MAEEKRVQSLRKRQGLPETSDKGTELDGSPPPAQTDSEDDALDKIQDLALQYYESGHPDPSTISFVRHGETQSFPDGEGFYWI